MLHKQISSCKIILNILFDFVVHWFIQGLEIVNPVAMEKKVAEANAKYFSATSGFRSVKKMDASYFSAKPLDGKSWWTFVSQVYFPSQVFVYLLK